MNSSWVTSLIMIWDLGTEVQLFLSFIDHLAPSLIFFHLQWYEDSLTYLKHMLRAQYLGMSLARVIGECSSNH